MPEVIELARFKIDPKDEEAFLAAREGMVEAVTQRLPGLRAISLARLDDGTWIDVVFWDDRGSAAEAPQEAGQLRPVQEWMSHIAEDVSMEQGDVIDRVPCDD
jgi:heme-degrading monooxygenase HmoA